MILGYPGVGEAVRFTATKGSIAGLPEDYDGSYATDAASNPGNSGGPVCDITGSVVAIHWGRVAGHGSCTYGMGVPSYVALPFLAKVVPGLSTPTLKAALPATNDWADVARNASPSTILIHVQERMSNRGLPTPTSAQHWQGFEDPWCMNCGGSGFVKCPQCRGTGTTPTTKTEQVGANPITKQQIFHQYTVRVRCTRCKGTGKLRCPDCNDGIERSLPYKGSLSLHDGGVNTDPPATRKRSR